MYKHGWPSGLRRQFKVLLSKDAWVRTPLHAFLQNDEYVFALTNQLKIMWGTNELAQIFGFSFDEGLIDCFLHLQHFLSFFLSLFLSFFPFTFFVNLFMINLFSFLFFFNCSVNILTQYFYWLNSSNEISNTKSKLNMKGRMV